MVLAVATHPVSDEIGSALAAFVAGGVGPKHSTLSLVFGRCGLGDVAPYEANSQKPQSNKSDRVRKTVSAAVRAPQRSRELIEGLLGEFRREGLFEVVEVSPFTEHEYHAGPDRQRMIQNLQEAFHRIDWEVTPDGQLRPAGIGSVQSIGDRPAIEDQLSRLRRASDDPALLLGTAKEMLESTAKYVAEAFSVPIRSTMSFDELWHLARDRLKLLPEQVEMSEPGAKEVRTILQSSWTIVRMTNQIRNDEGTGHGRTLPTAVTQQIAMMVVREACSVAELVLSELDRATGR